MMKRAKATKVTRRELLKAAALAGMATSLPSVWGGGAERAWAAVQSKSDESAKPDLDKARKEGVVNFYTSLDTAIVDSVLKPFKEKYGVDVKYYRAGAREVITKVMTEWDAKALQCDVLDASELPAFLDMKQRNMFAQYRPESYDAIKDEKLKDKDGYWTCCRLTQVIIGYNTNVYKGDAIPKRWQDLTDPRFSGKMCLQTPEGFIPRIFCVVENLFGKDNINKGWAWLEAIGKNKPRYVQSVQVMCQMNETGEIPVSIFQNDNLMARSKDNGRPVDLVWPAEGLPTEPGGVALMKTTTHPNAGKLLVDWWVGKEGQEILIKSYKYSPRNDISAPKGYPALSSLKLWEENNEYIDKNRVEITKRISRALGA